MSRRSPLPRCGRFLLAVAMVLVWTGAVNLLGEPARADNPTTPAALTPAQKVDLLTRLILVLRDTDRDDMRRMDDLEAVVHDANGDPLKLCQWVSQNTWWVPYHGVLRGSAGVMLDRLGNSMDRAILLARLLKTAGLETRLAHATLPDAVAAAQLAKIKRPGSDWHPPAFDPGDKDKLAFDGYLQKYSVDPKWIQGRQAEDELSAEQTQEAIVQRAAEQMPVIGALVHAGPVVVSDSKSDRFALADDWWAEYRPRGGNDAWTALDPNCGDAAGKPPLAAAETVLRDSNGKFNFLPAVAHEVEIRVVVEQWLDGKLQEQVALKSVARPSELVGERVALGHLGMGFPDNLDPGKEPDLAGKLRQLAAEPREWIPTLQLGGQTIMQCGINPDGSIDEKPKLDALKNAAAVVAGGASKAVDALGGGPATSPEPAKPRGVMTAEWIDYEIRTPGCEPRTIRRELFDHIGPARRAAGVTTAPMPTDHQRIAQGFALLGITDIALQCCSVPRLAVKHLAAQNLLANAQILLALAKQPPASASDVSDMDGRIVLGATELFALASARFGSSPVGSSVYLDQLNILTKHTWLRESPPLANGQPSDSPFTVLGGYDIVENNVAVISAPGNDPAAIRMQQGIVDTVAESVLGNVGAAHSENTSELFAASTARGEPWIAVTARDAGKLSAMDLPVDVKQRMGDELKAGRTVLLPEKNGSVFAWWSVDPKTGQTLGIGGNGWGTEAAEYSLTTSTLVWKTAVYFACLGAVVHGRAGGDSGGKAVAGAAACTAGFIAGIMGYSAAGDAISAISSGVSFMK
jgi:hypothetical protein